MLVYKVGVGFPEKLSDKEIKDAKELFHLNFRVIYDKMNLYEISASKENRISLIRFLVPKYRDTFKHLPTESKFFSVYPELRLYTGRHDPDFAAVIKKITD